MGALKGRGKLKEALALRVITSTTWYEIALGQHRKR